MNYILHPYDLALLDVIENGEERKNRTGENTLSVFGYQIKIDISERFPILTKRKMFYKSIFAELLWILAGETNIVDLENKGSKIWAAWRSEDFEKENGYEFGDLGPIYGWQLRHFGAEYKKNKEDRKEGEGFDQLEYIINELKNNKDSRRILFSYWNPPDVLSKRCRLPPCHDLFQLNVDNKNRLSGLLYQRSADLPIGSPANIQFYSALIYMLAQQCGFTQYQFVYSIGDAHVYKNQIPSISEYLSRDVIDSPKLELNKAKDIYSYSVNDFKIIDYKSHGKLVIPVMV